MHHGSTPGPREPRLPVSFLPRLPAHKTAAALRRATRPSGRRSPGSSPDQPRRVCILSGEGSACGPRGDHHVGALGRAANRSAIGTVDGRKTTGSACAGVRWSRFGNPTNARVVACHLVPIMATHVDGLCHSCCGCGMRRSIGRWQESVNWFIRRSAAFADTSCQPSTR